MINNSQELQRQKYYLQKSQEMAKIGIWEVDILKNTLYWSDEIYRIFGLDKEKFEPSYEGFLDAIHPEDRENLNKEYQASIQEKREYFIAHRIIRPDGSLLYVEERGEHTYNEKHEVIKTVGIVLDVTDKKELEILLMSVNKNLDKRVQTELEKNRVQDKKMKEQSRLAQMGEMISMIAHQWRQPLGAISATVVNLKLKIELESFDLESKIGVQEASLYFLQRLDSITEYVQNLTTTIDDFRNFYKPDKKAVSIKLEDIMVKSLNIIEVALLSDNIEIQKEYNSDEMIEVYDSEVMQVILNILKNAQDNFQENFNQKPYIKIEIRERMIIISDNGGGIDEEIMDKIFDPYFSTKDEKNGTGLGLYMSKLIIEEHHKGRLSASNKDDGVCFKIEFGTI